MRRGVIVVSIVCALLIAYFVIGRRSNEPGKAASQGEQAAPSARPSQRPRPVGSAEPASTSEHKVGAKHRTFFAPWGGSKDQLGRDRPQEGNPVAPMSVAHDAKGRVLILDQVNGRVVKRGADGSVEATFPEKLRDAQDMAVGADGHVALLDRLGDKSIALFDDNGNPSGELSLDGFGDTGIITGVQIDGNDVYVEREHGPLVKIGDTSGHMATPQTEIPGRPSRDGLSFLNAGITDQAAGRVWVSSIIRETGEHRFTRELRMRAEVHSIVLLDSDKKGTIYFAAALHEEPSADWVLLECLDPLNGSPIGSAVLPPNLMPEETFRDLVVLDEGGVIYAVRSEEGVSYEHYDCE